MEPRPVIVDVNWVVKYVLEINCKTEEANSCGSTKLLIYRSRPAVVEIKEADEMYPAVPNPATVDVNWVVKYVLEINCRAEDANS